jgi:hypothetical protein
MSKQLILNLFLLIVVISLASIIYFSEEKSTQLERLSDINLDSISSIKILHNHNKVSLSRTVGNKTKQQVPAPEHNWQITSPIKIAANNFRINSVLNLLNAPIHNKYALTEIDNHKIGLNNSATSIQFNNQVITFGLTNPVTNLRYIQLNTTVYTIEDVYFPLISSHFGTLVSLNLLPPNSTITKLILLNQTLSKDEAGRWQSNVDLSTDNVAKTLQYWLQTKAFGVRQYLPRKVLGEVFIYIDDSAQPIRFQITDSDPWLILARPELNLEYHLDIEAYNNLISPTNSNNEPGFVTK